MNNLTTTKIILQTLTQENKNKRIKHTIEECIKLNMMIINQSMFKDLVKDNLLLEVRGTVAQINSIS